MTAVAIVSVTWASPVSAQCSVRGTIRDTMGLPVPGARVIVAGGAPSFTDADGQFCVAALAPGRNQITVSMDGFDGAAVEVTGTAADTLVRDFILSPSVAEDVVVTATRTSRRLDDVPVRTEVVDRDALEQIGARTLADAVEFTTGVRVESNCQNCNFSQIRLLGLDGAYTQILIDSQPVVSSLAQVYGVEQIPSRMIERIEIVKGGGSALYGPGSVGGVVNVIPREPSRPGAALESRTEVMDGQSLYATSGSADWVSASRSSFATVFGQIDRIPGIDLTGDGFTEVSRRRLDAGGARLGRYVLGNAAKATIDASVMRERRRGGNKIDLAPDQADLAEDIDSRRQSVAGTWFHRTGAASDYRLVASWAGMKRDSYYGGGQDPNAYGDSSNNLFVVEGQLNRYAGRHTLSLGAQATRETLIDRQPAYSRFVDQDVSSAGVFAQDEWAVAGGWAVVAGGRLDTHSAMASAIFSPRLALKYSPHEALTMRASMASGFRAPVVFDEDLHLSSVGGDARIILLSPTLREEHSLNATAGIEWRPAMGAGQGLFEVNGFSTRLDDLFFNAEADDSSTDAVEFEKVNLGRARVYGVEVNLGWGIGNGFVLQGGMVEQRARFDEAEPNFGSLEFFRTPQRYGNLTLSWATRPLGQLFAGVRYTGPMLVPHYAGFIDEDRLERSASFVTLDVGVTRSLGNWDGRQIALTLNGRNLTNAYQSDLDQGADRDSDYVYGPRFPRSFSIGVRFDLGRSTP